MSTTTIERATDKQITFLRDLFAEIADLPAYADDESLRNVDWDAVASLGKQTVSQIIESALKMRADALRQAAADGIQVGDVPEGIHYHDGTVYRVKRSAAGNYYAMRLGRTGTFKYVGRRPLANLSADTVMTYADAVTYGKAFGICARCGATLSNPESVGRGIGPICAQSF